MKNTKTTKGKVITLVAVAAFTLSIGAASAFAAANTSRVNPANFHESVAEDGTVLARIYVNKDENGMPVDLTDEEWQEVHEYTAPRDKNGNTIPPSEVTNSGILIDLHSGGSHAIALDSVNLDYWREFTPEEYEAYQRGVINLGDGVQRRGSTDPNGTERIYELVARPISPTVLINGENVSFDAYSILGSHYFKLRDLAYVLSSTEKQFEVSWNSENNAILLTSGKPYTPVGGELASGHSENGTPSIPELKIYLNGKEVRLNPYNIGGSFYVKLCDIGSVFDFSIAWDSSANLNKIDTSVGYSPE